MILLFVYWTQFWRYICIGSALEGLALNNAAQRTGRRVKWTSGARLTITVDRSIARAIARSIIARSVPRSLGRSNARSLDRSIAQSLGRSVAPSLGRSVGRSVARSLGRSIARSIARSLDRSIARSIGRSLDRSIVQLLDRLVAPSLDRSIARSIGRSLDRSIVQSLDRLDGVSPQKLHPRCDCLWRRPSGTLLRSLRPSKRSSIQGSSEPKSIIFTVGAGAWLPGSPDRPQTDALNSITNQARFMPPNCLRK